MRIIAYLCCSFLCLQTAYNQSDKPLANRVNLVFGLGQITQGGFNVEGNLFYNRLVIDYSHGISLNLGNEQLETGTDKTQGLAIHLPWTTGFGLGYRFNNWLNIRAEPKWHRFELFYQDDPQTNNNVIGDYTTFTLGLGLYANWFPFKNSSSFLKGIMLVPNLRWWPRVSSSLEGNELIYNNRLSEQMVTHQARQIGINNTPFFYNLSVGYSIKF